MDTDRNLLFAVLALQSRLIDRDQFIQACTLWATQKDVPIADLLVEQGWLMPVARGLVEQLLALNLAQHGDDVGASLAAAVGAEARGALASIADADVQQSVAALPSTGPDADPFGTIPTSEGDCAGGNLLYEEIGRGGMGCVLRGRDRRLGRELAVKVLRPEYSGNADVEGRFVEEAQIGGQLQHPGVVPVYELGRFPDRRPFFTMKLVKGRTLAQLLKERPDPRHEQARFLTIFEQVCQTVAYAHSKGVIHRDLKPSNVMVGAFGEVQVMDWGLAKVLSRDCGGADPEATTAASLIRTVRSGSTAEGNGRTGVVGTPSYMAPEQARGEVEAVDERADVFGLGAVLCAILTGQPPYADAEREAVQRKAAAGDLAEAFARLDGCGADAELVTLCKECLAPERQGRPSDAGAVAARVAAHQAAVRERLRRAELERAAAEARAVEERKRRRVSLALAAAVLALIAVGAGGGLWVQRQAVERREDQARRDVEQRQTVEFALEKATGLRQQAHWREAAAVLEQARRVLGDTGPDDLRQRLDVADAELALVNRLDAIRQRRATWVEGGFDTRTAVHDYAEAFREAGLGDVGDDEAAVAARVRASGVSGPLVAALDDWALAAKEPESKSWLLGVARLADPNPWGDRFRDPAVWRDRPALQALADDALRDDGAKLDELSPQVLRSLGVLLGEGAEAVPLWRAAQRRYPNDFWLSLHLGNALKKAKQAEEVVGYFRVAVALRPDAAVAHNNLGAALYDKKDPDGAIAEYHKAIDLDPKDASAHNGLGAALHDKKDVEGAIAEYRKAIDLDPKDASAHSNLGLALYDKKDVDGAIAEYRTAIDSDPTFAAAHHNLGLALRAKKDVDGAIAEFRKAIDLDPKYANAHTGLGAALADKKDLDGAIAEFRKAIDLDPKLANAHTGLGVALRDKKDLDGAIAEFRTAIDLDPKNAELHNGLGIAMWAKKDVDGAIAAYRKAIDLDPKLALAHNNLGLALRDKKDLDGAIAEYRKAIDLDPKDASAHYNLGAALYDKKDLDGAIAEYRTALRLKPDYPEAHCNLGYALRDRGDFAASLAALRRGHELGSQRPGWPYPSAQWVKDGERLLALDEKLSAFLSGEAEPADAAERIALAQLCQQYKHRHAAAVRFYAGAFAAEPRAAADLRQQFRYNAARSAALAAAGRAEDAKLLPDKVALMLRRQGLRWLRADLALYAKLAEEEPAAKQAVRQRLAHWQEDTDLASVRDQAALDKLPDDERQEWRQLWDDVAALLKKVEAKK